MADLTLRELSCWYGETRAVHRLSIDVADGELLTLLGPSGSGKSTVLRLIAGYVRASEGEIRIAGRRVDALPPEQRDVGMVFQSYALFPHLTVRRNVAFGLERRRLPRLEIDRRVADALAQVELASLDHRYPRELSGGQQQRVALARALVIRPTLLLLDEPLSNLDARLRQQVRVEIRRLQRELGITTVWVTHDQEDALAVSDRVAVLRQGELQQVGSPTAIYGAPVNAFVASFVGRMNLLDAVCESVSTAGALYRLPGGHQVTVAEGPARAQIGVRPEAIHEGTPPPGVAANCLRGVVEERIFHGELVQDTVCLDDGRTRLVRRTLARDTPDVRPGDAMSLWWRVADTRAFEPDAG